MGYSIDGNHLGSKQIWFGLPALDVRADQRTEGTARAKLWLCSPSAFRM